MDSNELERQVLLKIFAAAKNIAEYSWDDIDADAKKDMEKLIKAVEDMERFLEIKRSAENSYQASMMRNAAR